MSIRIRKSTLGTGVATRYHVERITGDTMHGAKGIRAIGSVICEAHELREVAVALTLIAAELDTVSVAKKVAS